MWVFVAVVELQTTVRIGLGPIHPKTNKPDLRKELLVASNSLGGPLALLQHKRLSIFNF